MTQLEYLQEIDQPIIRLWNACKMMPEDIADLLGVDLEYVENVIEDPANYRGGK